MTYKITFWGLAIFLASCTYNNSSPIGKITLTVDRENYRIGDDVNVTLTNKSEFDLQFFICNGQLFPTLDLQKLEGSKWSTVWASICNGFNSYCCGAISKNLYQKLRFLLKNLTQAPIKLV